jgi:hypothetical protein
MDLISKDRVKDYSNSEMRSVIRAEITAEKKWVFTCTVLPTADQKLRGKIYTLLGGAGVADITYCCQKNAADAYVWTVI